MKLGIDLDGVLLDILKPTLDEYNLRYRTNFTPDDIIHYKAHQILGISVDEFLSLLDFIYINDFHSIRPYEIDVNNHLKRLRDNGHQIIIVTRRNLKTIPNVINILKKWKIGIDGFICVNNSLDKTVANVDIMIDDSREVTDVFGSHGFLIKRSYNHTYDIESIADFTDRFLEGKIALPEPVTIFTVEQKA